MAFVILFDDSEAYSLSAHEEVVSGSMVSKNHFAADVEPIVQGQTVSAEVFDHILGMRNFIIPGSKTQVFDDTT